MRRVPVTRRAGQGQTGAQGTRVTQGVRTPGALSCESGFATSQRSHHLGVHNEDLDLSASGQKDPARRRSGIRLSEHKRGGRRPRSLRARREGDGTEELLCQPRLSSRWLPPSSPASSVMIPTFKGIRTTF